MKLITSYIFLSAAFLLAFSGCKKEYETIEQLDEQNIQAYLTQKNLDMELDSEGFYYHIIEQGSGSAVDYTDKVFVTFTMTSLDGKYTSTDEYVTNRYSSYLGYLDREHSGMPAAFREAVKKLNKGGSIRVVIPSRLAYGRNGFNKIPGNASLDCTLSLYDVEDQAGFDDIIIQKFAVDKNLDLTKDTTGIYYQIIEPGTGTEPVADTTEITVQYKLRYLNGTIIDQTTAASPYKSILSVNIEGFQLGVSKLKKGGKMRLIIPSGLAYGPNPGSGIRANAILDYDVELVDVKNE